MDFNFTGIDTLPYPAVVDGTSYNIGGFPRGSHPDPLFASQGRGARLREMMTREKGLALWGAFFDAPDGGRMGLLWFREPGTRARSGACGSTSMAVCSLRAASPI